jgi:hypothetical protein
VHTVEQYLGAAVGVVKSIAAGGTYAARDVAVTVLVIMFVLVFMFRKSLRKIL